MKKKIINISSLLVLFAAIVYVLASCHRHDYYSLRQNNVNLRIEFDWDGYIDIPPGMNLVFYPIIDEYSADYDYSGSPIPYQLQYDGGSVSLPVGRYNVAIYNDYTYSINYQGMDSFLTAMAYLDEYNRAPLASRAPVVRNVAEPDIFYVAQILQLTLSPGDGDRTIVVRPILKTLKLFVHVIIDGIQNVSMADGSITGATGNIMLATGLSPDSTASRRVYSFSVGNTELYAETKLFLYNHPLEETYTLELAFLLRNNQVKVGNYVYDVSDQMIEQLQANNGEIPPEGIHIYIRDIVIDDVASDGFDAVVDGWGDETIIELN